MMSLNAARVKEEASFDCVSWARVRNKMRIPLIYRHTVITLANDTYNALH